MRRSLRMAGKGGGALAAAILAAAALAGTASPARAGDEDLREELEKTREQVRSLLRRVEELERGAKAGDGELAKAVDAYLAARPAAAQAGGVTAPGCRSLRFSGQVLWWWEQWNRSYRSPDPAGHEVENIGWLRTSLQADADVQKDLRARVEIRDARAFGAEPSTTAQLQASGMGLDLKQGWFEADDLFGCGTATRAGRMVLSYGDQRLVGDLDWATYGRSFDGLLFSRDFEATGTRADLFATRVLERGTGTVVPGVDTGDRDFAGIYTRTPKALHHSDLDACLLLLHDGARLPGDRPGHAGNTTLWTAGARLAGAKDGFDWGTEEALQVGTLAGDHLLAWAGHARLGYTMADTRWTPRLGVEWDRATGDGNPGDGDRGAFQTLFPTNHMHYGILDLMAWQNMQAFRASLRLAPAKAWTVDADVWRLYLDEEEDSWVAASGAAIRPGAAGASRYLGTEADLVVTWKPTEHLRIAAGGAQFLDGGFVRDTGGGGDTSWFYVRILVTF